MARFVFLLRTSCLRMIENRHSQEDHYDDDHSPHSLYATFLVCSWLLGNPFFMSCFVSRETTTQSASHFWEKKIHFLFSCYFLTLKKSKNTSVRVRDDGTLLWFLTLLLPPSHLRLWVEVIFTIFTKQKSSSLIGKVRERLLGRKMTLSLDTN